MLEKPSENDSIAKQSSIDSTQDNPDENNARPAQHLMGLFVQPQDPPLLLRKPFSERHSTLNFRHLGLQQSSSFDQQSAPLLGGETPRNPISSTPRTRNGSRRSYNTIPSVPPLMEPIFEDVHGRRVSRLCTVMGMFVQQHMRVGTLLGGFVFFLHHIVFCLAMGSTISAEHLGIMAKMAASGVIFASPIYIHFLGDEIPSQYPTTDLFLAPFMAKLAVIVNETLSADENVDDKDHTVFFSTFAVLSSIGMLGSASLIMLASAFKLANLGRFLPFPVLCGFFSAVAVLLWTRALGVDTGGKTVGQVSASLDSLTHAIIHHGPSMVAGSIMKMHGHSNPFFNTFIIAGTIALTYGVMFATDTSLADATEAGWFWTHNDLLPPPDTGLWLPPAPFGVWFGLQYVHWGAVYNGLQTTTALSFLYLMRCSLHATALKKNVSNLERAESHSVNVTTKESRPVIREHRRRWTEDVDIEAIENATKEEPAMQENTVIVSAKIPTVPLQKVLLQYGYVQFFAAVLGSFSVTPSVNAMDKMYKLGADGRAPQYMSLLVLLAVYLTDFSLVAYIPKMSFSCLIVASCLDMISTWYVESFYKTMEKVEWLVVPIIVVSSFVLGLLNSVFVGIAISTFIFVAAFFRSGVVKYLANGLSIRSTIERSFDASEWLDQHGDKIQVMVLQNYLFFGNASSMLNYVSMMFEDVRPRDKMSSPHDLIPIPRYLVMDLSLVTGMDTSTVGIFNDIKTVCSNHGAKLFVSGLSIPLRETLALGNFKPEGGERSKRSVRFFTALDAAIGKAEDCLLDDEILNNDVPKNDVFNTQDEAASFAHALEAIDEQHGIEVGADLMSLFEYTTPVKLEQGERLYSLEGGPVLESDRGLSFLASGLLKIERDSNLNTMRKSVSAGSGDSFGSLRGNRSLTARYRAVGKESMLLKAGLHRRRVTSFVRLARVGPGWVAGTLESVGATECSDRHVAVSRCKLHHLPHRKIEEIQEKDPALVLRLYKLLSHLTAKRQELTIGQLMTLHSIMTSPAAGKPIGRQRIRLFEGYPLLIDVEAKDARKTS
jgi:MFS superfamily sulfate permease-like transporter